MSRFARILASLITVPALVVGLGVVGAPSETNVVTANLGCC